MTENSCLAFARGLVIQLASAMVTFSLRSNVTAILIVPDSQLNSYNRELLPCLSLRERLDGPACECDGGILKCIRNTGACASERLTAHTQCPASSARKRKALCTSRMHLHDKPCLLHMALSFWPIRYVRTQMDTFWKIFFIYSNIIKLHLYNKEEGESLGTRLVIVYYCYCTEVCDDAPDMERLLMEIVEHRLVETCEREMDNNMVISTFVVLVVGIMSCKD